MIWLDNTDKKGDKTGIHKFMNTRYSRNRLYLTETEQQLIKHFPILLGGAGIGSIIAECLLRFGFEKLTIVDGDTVEVSNLNRQNYTEKDVSNAKVLALKERLLAINPEADITAENIFITNDNANRLIEGHKLAINALDFTSDIPLVFDRICQQNRALVIVIDKLGLDSLKEPNQNFNEVEVVRYVCQSLRVAQKPQQWLEKIIDDYLNENKQLSPPQLSVASWIAAGVCTQIAFNVAIGRPVKKFPEFYFSSISET
ncbi:MAG: ThiF family adenylyltransferase [Spirosomaceae bacterium]|nr:ThiF family adenylyltransferase [Spirosomataceae bacterium]